MANSWLRLWHDMPTDPKWRTIARVSGESIALVQATYLHLLVTASRNVTRGHANVTTEDLASALDVTEPQIQSVLNAMEGRVLENGYLSGWDKRQPKREDSGDDESGAKSAAARKRAQREREKLEQEKTPNQGLVTDSHEESRNVTTDKDKDKDKELNTLVTFPSDDQCFEKNQLPENSDTEKQIPEKPKNCPTQKIIDLYHETLPELPKMLVISEARKSLISARWKQNPTMQTIERWQSFFRYVRDSDFLMGRIDPKAGQRQWSADLEFLVTASSFAKVVEGKYHANNQ